jgi:hypothetical protein
MWKTLALVILAAVPAHNMYSQVPCPVSLTSANAERDSIKLEFMNKGKLPIEQLSLSCTPSANNKSRSAICHNETGIFYPGTEYWIEIAYPGANRHSAVIAVKEVRLAGGVFWNTRHPIPAELSECQEKTNLRCFVLAASVYHESLFVNRCFLRSPCIENRLHEMSKFFVELAALFMTAYPEICSFQPRLGFHWK